MVSVLLICLSIALLTICSGCASKAKSAQSGRYHLLHDRLPDAHEVPEQIKKIPDATPKLEPKSKYGNPAKYKVMNKTYYVLNSSAGYRERGYASWYGKKFHGYRTSSGEKYDMFAMTAAHKTLPLPSYLVVKNLENGKQIIVKVNDRGPFHNNRIVDLSYAAAVKLGLLNKGTARVEISAIDVKKFHQPKPTILAKAPNFERASKSSGHYLQLGAFSDRKNAEKLQQQAKGLAANKKVQIVASGNKAKPMYKVQVGPLQSLEESRKVKARLLAAKLPEPVLVQLRN